MTTDYDAVIVGGGFFGCCLALFLRSVMPRIAVVESGTGLLERASRVNQARVHAGFHYPRSFKTAMRSRMLESRFLADFKHGIYDQFDMLYAVAARRSKVTPARFARMFKATGSHFEPAPQRMRSLFNKDLVADVFLCREYAFDWTALRDDLIRRLDANGIALFMETTVARVQSDTARAVAYLADGRSLTTPVIFNVTYANLNNILLASGLAPLTVKHELAEVALIDAPAELERLAVTLMDGPFFSTMPFPAEGVYSLTHVRYTPHFSWVDAGKDRSAYQVMAKLPQQTRFRHMIQDASRYLPCLRSARHRGSLFDVKTVLIQNERDDGRPILLHRHPDAPRIVSVMGGKIDNIYDLFDVLPQLHPSWKDANASRLYEAR